MEISPEQARLLARLARTQRPTAIAGALLVIAGAAYAAWGLARFEPSGDPRLAPGFDRPVAQLAHFYEPFQSHLETLLHTGTPGERSLRGTLGRGMRFSSGLLMLLMRLFLGTIAVLAGLVMMTVMVERRRLLRIIERLQT